jgi:hypothetical protein
MRRAACMRLPHGQACMRLPHGQACQPCACHVLLLLCASCRQGSLATTIAMPACNAVCSALSAASGSQQGRQGHPAGGIILSLHTHHMLAAGSGRSCQPCLPPGSQCAHCWGQSVPQLCQSPHHHHHHPLTHHPHQEVDQRQQPVQADVRGRAAAAGTGPGQQERGQAGSSSRLRGASARHHAWMRARHQCRGHAFSRCIACHRRQASPTHRRQQQASRHSTHHATSAGHGCCRVWRVGQGASPKAQSCGPHTAATCRAPHAPTIMPHSHSVRATGWQP